MMEQILAEMRKMNGELVEMKGEIVEMKADMKVKKNSKLGNSSYFIGGSVSCKGKTLIFFNLSAFIISSHDFLLLLFSQEQEFRWTSCLPFFGCCCTIFPCITFGSSPMSTCSKISRNDKKKEKQKTF
jgi:hypothetical protein